MPSNKGARVRGAAGSGQHMMDEPGRIVELGACALYGEVSAAADWLHKDYSPGYVPADWRTIGILKPTYSST